jgi:hypothetical protein
MECSRCKAHGEQASIYGLALDKDVEILSAQPVYGIDPAVGGDFPNAFHAYQMSPDEDATQCKKCHTTWVTERKNTFSICPSCGFAGWKEYLP